MNPLVLEEARQCELEVNRRYDPSIRIVWAPKILRFVICEDKLVNRSSHDPWQDRDPDLEGAEYLGPFGVLQPIGARTTLEAKRRLESREGHFVPPIAELVIAILAHECPRVGDRSPLEFGSRAAKRRDEKFRRKLEEMGKDFKRALLDKRKNRVYSTPSVKR